MSDIWCVEGSDNDSVGKAAASEDWDCSSGSSEDERPSKRAKKGGNTRRPRRAVVRLDGSQPQEDAAADEGDVDLLAAYLSPEAAAAAADKASKPGGKKGGKGKKRSPSPLLIDADLQDFTGTSPGVTTAAAAAAAGADAVARPAATGAAAAAAGGAAGGKRSKRGATANGVPSPDPVRAAALQQRALREQLAQATHAAEEEEVEVVDDSDDGPALPSPAGRLDLTGEDPSASLLDDLAASQPDPTAAAAGAGTGAAGQAAAGGGAAAAGAGSDDGKLPLVFQVQGHDKITVRVHRQQPLAPAMDKVVKYAAAAGWGCVSKFMFDGERLAGDETPDDLAMDADEVVDVYLSA